MLKEMRNRYNCCRKTSIFQSKQPMTGVVSLNFIQKCMIPFIAYN